MKITGLITEYNPFHNGHLYHLNKSREMTDADYTVVVMSGDFLQRGTPAVINKYERTRMALSCGADLVLELPAAYACASAEFFAFGGISLLHSLGCVDSFVFGSETENLNLLDCAASMLANEPLEFQILLKKGLSRGLPFPQARVMAIRTLLGSYASDALSSPNNILGIEYLKALKRLNSPIEPFCLKRKGSGYHDTDIAAASDEAFASATGIRHAVESGADLDELSGSMPDAVLSILKGAQDEHFPITEEDFSSLIHYKLLLSRGNYTDFADITPELAIRIARLLPEYQNLGSFIDLLKSRNYTRTRISRCLMHILLEMRDMGYKSAFTNVSDAASAEGTETLPVPYARILGFRKASSAVLSQMRKTSRIPLITKVADARHVLESWYSEDAAQLSYARELFTRDLFAADVYEAAAAQKFGTKPINEYTHGVVIL